MHSCCCHFRLVIQLQLKFFGVIFLLTLVGFVVDACFENTQYVNVEASHLEILDELKNDLTDIVLSLKALRKDSPSSVSSKTTCPLIHSHVLVLHWHVADFPIN